MDLIATNQDMENLPMDVLQQTLNQLNKDLQTCNTTTISIENKQVTYSILVEHLSELVSNLYMRFPDVFRRLAYTIDIPENKLALELKQDHSFQRIAAMMIHREALKVILRNHLSN